MSADLSALTVGEFLHTLRQVVAEKGANYVYPDSEKRHGACRYRVNGEPSCLIGHALDRLGHVVPPSLEEQSASHVLGEFGAPEPVRRVARHAQAAQDRGRPWGEVLSAAERAVAA